jgi:hypothetical protein
VWTSPEPRDPNTVTDQDRNKAWGFALFGDDVRVELGGKTSLMGMYQSDMLFPGSMKFPFLLPKFIIQIMYYEVVSTIDSDLIFRVTHGFKNETIAEMPVLRKDLGVAVATVGNEEASEDSERVIHIRIPLVLSPFQITEMGRLRVRAHYSDGAVLKLGSIAIRQIPDDEFRIVTGLPITPQP